MEVVLVNEGSTAFFVPKQDPDHNFPPGSAPVFFNSRMELNRDATILLLSVLRPSDYLDAMGASGVRGLRVANECSIPVTINDRSDEAVRLIRQNVESLGREIEVTHADVNALMSARSFDAVDLDPFGTPAPFVDAGARSSRRFLFVTATDTAPLCGAHLKAGMRRYFSRPMNTEYHAEVALRTLLGFVVREVIKYDRGVEPVFCFAREHFIRLHLRIRNGATAADRSLQRIGFILQCPYCMFRTEQPGFIPEGGRCECCGAELVPIGPLWLGRINDTGMLEAMRDTVGGMTLGTGHQCARLIETLLQELDSSSHYDYHVVAKTIQASPAPIDTVIGRLRERGYQASRAHYSGTGIKTDAPPEEIKTAVSAA